MADVLTGAHEPTTADLARKSNTPGPDGRTVAQQAPHTHDERTPLFSESETDGFRSRWNTIQTAFVDEPRRTVEDADKLVAAVMQRLAEQFANERSALEKEWDKGGDVSTEALRVLLQRYRSFFDRLLKI